ncbi:MAG: ankyrin repeat domain-containing protein [Vicinamibacterales bacterium]
MALVVALAFVNTSPLHAQLHQAILKGDVAAAQDLIARGTDLDLPDANGFTPLQNAAILGYADIVTALLDRGVDGRGTGKVNRSPRELAEFSGKREAFHRLLVWESLHDRVNGSVQSLPYTAPYVQRTLASLGLFRGIVDGQFGPQTAAAIDTLRRQYKLSGNPQDTLEVRIVLWTVDPITRRKGSDGGAPAGCNVCITRIWRQTPERQLESAGGCDATVDVILRHTAEIRRASPLVPLGSVGEIVTKTGANCRLTR